METDAPWNMGARPAAGEMSVAENHGAGKNHEAERLSILVWSCTLAPLGKKYGNQQYTGQGMYLFLRLLPGGSYHKDAN